MLEGVARRHHGLISRKGFGATELKAPLLFFKIHADLCRLMDAKHSYAVGHV